MGGKLEDILQLAAKIAAREGYAPEKSVKAYKLFREKQGGLYPLFVPHDGNEAGIPVGEWLRAESGVLTPQGKVKSSIGPLAYRPGWHAGDLPIATHIGGKSSPDLKAPDYRPSGQVWGEVDMADDVPWQAVAEARALLTKKGLIDPKTAHITDQVPVGGHYRYKTNPNMTGNWLIGGDMRINRLLSDDEVKAINDAAGVADLPRREGYAGGGWLDDVVRLAGEAVAGKADDAARAVAREGADAASGLPAHLQEGYKAQAAPGATEEAKGLVDYLREREHLSFDPQSRAERRADLGFNVDGYHGSPRDLDRFRNHLSDPAGYWGGHHYATSNPDDASLNYATKEGPDLKNRIDREIETVLNDEYHPDFLNAWSIKTYGEPVTSDNQSARLKEWSEQRAMERLGITNDGAVYPLALRMKNPVKTDSPNRTFWDYNVQQDENGDIIGEEGPAVQLMQHIADALYDNGALDQDVGSIMGKVGDYMADNGGLDPQGLRDLLEKEIYLYTDEGSPISAGHVLSDAFQRMGHDSIDMPGGMFKSMPGVTPDTRHYIIFDPKNIRSRNAAFDPFKADSDRISDAYGGRIAKGGAGSVFGDLVRGLLGPSERKGLMELTKPGSGYAGIPGKPSTVKLPGIGEVEAKPIPGVMGAAEGYMAKRGLPGSHAIDAFPPLDEDFAAKVAEAYERMRHAPNDPAVRRSYDAMAQETMDQFAAAKDAGIDFTAIRGADPYAASPAIGYADIAERGNLHFFPTDAGFGSSIDFNPENNPLLKRVGRIGDLDNATVNDAFRIVHDLYGHYGPGNPFFRAPGEERAYKLHRRMYSDDALPAMTSETRGQNSWLNFGPHGAQNRNALSADTTFADQKTGIMEPWTYDKAHGGEVDAAVRLARDVGGPAPQAVITDANGVQYDAKGNVIQGGSQTPTSSTAEPRTPEAIAAKAVNDPATFDALMERYAVPDRDIADYESLRDEVQKQPQQVQQMTHIGEKPRREMTVDMPLFGGEYSMGSAPYDVAENMQGMAQSAYDFKTVPFYFTPAAPVATAMDTAEGVMTGDPTTAGLAVAFGPGGKYTKAAGVGAIGYLMNPEDAEAGPARWFSKAVEAAKALPMEKMTGEQALAMLRKGVSPEELRWMKAEPFLSGKKQVTKADLVDFLEKNRIQPKEIVLGGPPPVSRDQIKPDADTIARFQGELDTANAAVARAREAFHAGYNSPDESALFIELGRAKAAVADVEKRMVDEQMAKMGGMGSGRPPKYEDYSTKGGEGYRETLYAMPPTNSGYRVERKGNMWHVVDEGGQTVRGPTGVPRTYYDEFDANHTARSLNRFGGDYTSPHWDDPNVLMHTRSQTLKYEPPGANRPYTVHNVDETQSDLGQSGRKQGFRDPVEIERLKQLERDREALDKQQQALMREIKAEYDEAVVPLERQHDMEDAALFKRLEKREITQREYETLLGDLMNKFSDAKKPYRERMNQRTINEVSPLSVRIGQLSSELTPLRNNQNKPPLMPYVGSTEGWTDFAIKKELDRALDSGHDYFSWSPGEVHADRYGLEKHIGKVEYNPDDGSFMAYDPNGKMVVNTSINDPSELDEYVGSELAEKIRKEEDSRRADYWDNSSVERDEETGDYFVAMNGEPAYDYYGNLETFSSRGDAKDAINRMMQEDFASNPVRLEGLDLKTGGEGMKGYYNKLYLKRVQEVLKKATGKKPAIEEIEVQTADGPRKQLGIRLDDEMREKARFSDFNRGGSVVDRALRLTRDAA